MRSSLTARKTARTALLTIGYVLMACFVLFPIVWILMMSFKQFGDIIAYPPRFLFSPTLDNYEQILFGSEAEQAAGQMPNFLGNLINSIIISGGAVIVSTLIGVPAAFALARGALGDMAFAKNWEIGQRTAWPDAVADALTVLDRAREAPACLPPIPHAGALDLSRREQEILALLCQRQTNAEMAAALFLSPRTVETHVARVIAKLGASNRREAAALAVRNGLA